MVLKKPYAFIIKHFRAIHLLLLIPMFYLTTQTREIVGFFNDYIASGYSIRFVGILSNLASNYINIFMYIAVAIILGVFITISLVLQQKDKPTKFYNISIVYYVIIFGLITASFSVFSMIERDLLDDILARFIRDLCYIVHFSQYIFIVFTIARGVGFNIKKFNFKNDLAQLEISEEDSEEFEFLVGRDPYKTKRTIRRFFRELKYYYKENKFIFTIIFILIFGILGTVIYMNREVYQRVYKENEPISFGYLNLTVKDTFISDLSKKGKVINKDKTYVILQIDVHNRYYQDRDFNFGNVQLKVNKKYYSPNISISSYFSDFGNPYNGTMIKALTKNPYILVYEIDKYLASSKFSVVAFSNYDITPGGLGAINKTINIKPTIINSKVISNNVSKRTNVNFNRTPLKNTSASIIDYEITNRHEFTYEYCITPDNCHESFDSVAIDYSIDVGKTLLVLDYKLDIDKNSSYMYSNKNYRSFFEDFMEIKYTMLNRKTYYEEVKIANPPNYDDMLAIKVSNKIEDAISIEAVITVRNVSYSIKLK